MKLHIFRLSGHDFVHYRKIEIGANDRAVYQQSISCFIVYANFDWFLINFPVFFRFCSGFSKKCCSVRYLLGRIQKKRTWILRLSLKRRNMSSFIEDFKCQSYSCSLLKNQDPQRKGRPGSPGSHPGIRPLFSSVSGCGLFFSAFFGRLPEERFWLRFPARRSFSLPRSS